jgi:hypothetical protein
MRILFLTTVLPGRRRMGSEAASQSIIDALRESGAEVTVIGYVRSGDDYRVGTSEVCAGRRPIETRAAGWRPLVWFLASVSFNIPYSVAKYRSRAFVGAVRTALREKAFELVVVDHVQMSWLLTSIRMAGPVVAIAHNVEHQMYRDITTGSASPLQRWLYAREGRKLHGMERALASRVDQLWVLTRADAESFGTLRGTASVREISMPANPRLSTSPAPAKEFDVGLAGSWTWKANDCGIRWFFAEVYPQLPSTCSIRVAGSGADWLRGRYRNVEVAGFVDDLDRWLRSARVIAIPTLSGGGIQIKTLDAIASGTPIVATPVALRGIDDPPSTVSVARNATEFAARLEAAIAHPVAGEVASDALDWSLQRRRRLGIDIARNIEHLMR